MWRFEKCGGAILVSALLSAVWGCGGVPPVPAAQSFGVLEADRSSLPLLVSEVESAEHPASLLNREFILANPTAALQRVSLAGKSCSCYGALLDGESWEMHDAAVLAPFARRTLTFDVQPPSQPGEKSWRITLALGEPPATEQVVTLGVRVYPDLVLEPESIFESTPAPHRASGTLPSAQTPPHASPDSKRHPLLIRRVWRRTGGDVPVPKISGYPHWAEFTPPAAFDEPQELAPGLWQHWWRSEMQIVGAANAVPPDVYPFTVSFTDAKQGTQTVRGRIVLKEDSGVTAPTVVHWGQISPGTWRKRRILLKASDDRAFQLTGSELQNLSPAEPSTATANSFDVVHGDEPHVAPPSLWLSSPAVDLNMQLDGNEAGLQQSVVLEIRARGAGLVDETLVLATDHPRAPLIRIRLRAVVQDVTTAARLSGD